MNLKKVDLNFLDPLFKAYYYKTVRTRVKLQQQCNEDKWVRATALKQAAVDPVFFCNYFLLLIVFK